MNAAIPNAAIDVSSMDGRLHRSELQRASALVERLRSTHQSTAEMLHELRRAFPGLPLSTRVAALGGRALTQTYSPR